MDYLRSRRICCASIYLWIPVTLAWRVLGVHWPPFRQLRLLWFLRWRLRSVFSRRSWARWLGVSFCFGWLASWEPYGHYLACLLDSLILRGDHLRQESFIPSQIAWSGPSCLGKVGLLTLSVTFLLEGLIGLIKALAELGRFDIPAVGFSFGRYTSCIGWIS